MTKPVPLPVRGVHLDCRAQMLRFPRLVEVFHDLARWGFNAVLFEYEDRFPFRGRLQDVPAADALSRRQVQELNRVAAGLGLRLIPLVQCLGHLEYVLRHPSFRALREGPGYRQQTTVCPSRAASRSLFREMASQVLEMHPGCRWFHMGGDEIGLDGSCRRCGPRLEKTGPSPILVDHYLGHADWLRAQGPDPILWGDMLLAHPEELGRLRGRVTLMDWDYWSRGRAPEQTVLWGFRNCDPRRPHTWPALYRKLYAPYILDGRTHQPRPFPYSTFLRDQGFPVIVASAARSSGDNFCVPRPLHLGNVVTAARTAHRAHLLGSVITSWALRRAPWPLTEHILIAGSLAMQDPAATHEEMAERFVREHFNVADLRLARIPILLGMPLGRLDESCPRFDWGSGHWLTPPFAERLKALQDGDGFDACRAAARSVAANCRQALALLRLARPATARQRQRVALWRWAAETLALYARLVRQIPRPPASRPSPAAGGLPPETTQLADLGQQLLAPFYTNRTLAAERQSRFAALSARAGE